RLPPWSLRDRPPRQEEHGCRRTDQVETQQNRQEFVNQHTFLAVLLHLKCKNTSQSGKLCRFGSRWPILRGGGRRVEFYLAPLTRTSRKRQGCGREANKRETRS